MQGDNINSPDLNSPAYDTKQVTPSISVNVDGKGKDRWPDKQKKAEDDQMQGDIMNSPDLNSTAYMSAESSNPAVTMSLKGKGVSLEGKGGGSEQSDKKRKTTNDNDQIQSMDMTSLDQSTKLSTPKTTALLVGKGKGRWPDKQKKAADDQIQGDIMNSPDLNSPAHNTKQVTPSVPFGGERPDKKEVNATSSDEQIHGETINSSAPNIKQVAPTVPIAEVDSLIGTYRAKGGEGPDKKEINATNSDVQIQGDDMNSPNLNSPAHDTKQVTPSVPYGGEGPAKKEVNATSSDEQIHGETISSSALNSFVHDTKQITPSISGNAGALWDECLCFT
jgi:hypothetical protein